MENKFIIMHGQQVHKEYIVKRKNKVVQNAWSKEKHVYKEYIIK